MPEFAGPDKAVPRGILALKTENKKEVLSCYFPMVMSGALPEYGGSQEVKKAVTHEKLAAMNGVRRETMTRRIGRCSSGQKRWTQERREKRANEERQRALKQGKKLTNRSLRSLEPAVTLLKITPNFGVPNSYEGPTGADAKGGGTQTRAAELLARKYGENVFDKTAKVNGFKDIPAWVWHPTLPDPQTCECQLGQDALFQGECPKCGGKGWHWREPGAAERKRGLCRGSLPDYGRALLTYYFLKRIEDELPEVRDKQTGKIVFRHKPANMLQIPQWKISEESGLHEDTIRDYNQRLCRLDIIKIVEGDKYGPCPGCSAIVPTSTTTCPYCEEKVEGAIKVTCSDPDKIILLCNRLLDREICLQERERFLKAKQDVEDAAWANLADKMHVDLLHAWEGKEHTLKAFWNELARRLATAGVPIHLRKALLPIYRE